MLTPIRRLAEEGFDVTELPVDREGRVTATKVADTTASRMDSLRVRLREHVQQIPGARVNTPHHATAPHILSVSFLGVRGETLLHRLEMDGIFVSTGSACHSHNPTPSHVLLAIGLTPEEAQSSLHFSLSHFTTADEIDAAAATLHAAVAELRTLVR